MKSYGRRDFLKAIGMGAAAAVVAPELFAQKVYPAGTRIQVEIESNSIVPRSFPWEFDGKCDFPAYPVCLPEGPVTHELLSVEDAPEGYTVAIRGLYIMFNNNSQPEDLKRLLESWTVSLRSDRWMVFDRVPLAQMLTSSGIGGLKPWMDWHSFPILPEILVGTERLTLSVQGKPFPLTGQLRLAASISGVAYESANVNSKFLKLTPEAKHVS
jgi:hypothetical protein